MIILELTEKQPDELYDEMLSNTSSLARKKCLIIYLRAKGYSRCEIADIARVDEDTVTNHVKIFADSARNAPAFSITVPSGALISPFAGLPS